MADVNVQGNSLKDNNEKEIENSKPVTYSIISKTSNEDRNDQVNSKSGKFVFNELHLLMHEDVNHLSKSKGEFYFLYFSAKTSIESSKNGNLFQRIAKSIAIAALCKSYL